MSQFKQNRFNVFYEQNNTPKKTTPKVSTDFRSSYGPRGPYGPSYGPSYGPYGPQKIPYKLVDYKTMLGGAKWADVEE